MPKQSIMCLATSREQANRMLDDLKNAKFAADNVTALYSEKLGAGDPSALQAPQGPATGAGLHDVSRVKYDPTMICVQIEGEVELARAKEIFTRAGAAACFTHSEPLEPGDRRSTDRPAIPTMAAYSGSGG